MGQMLVGPGPSCNCAFDTMGVGWASSVLLVGWEEVVGLITPTNLGDCVVLALNGVF